MGAVLTFLVTYGPTILGLLMKYGPVVEGWVKDAEAAGTLQKDAADLGEQAAALIGAVGSLHDLSGAFANALPADLANPQPGDPDPRLGSKAGR